LWALALCRSVVTLAVLMVGAGAACGAAGVVYRLPWLLVGVLAIAAVCLVAFLHLRYFMVCPPPRRPVPHTDVHIRHTPGGALDWHAHAEAEGWPVH
jgi:hypothetical protein